MKSTAYHLTVLLLFCLSLLNESVRAQSPPPSLTPQQIAGGHWQLTWSSVAGQRYILERSSNLVQWAEVGTVDASGPTSSLTDTGVPAAGRNFWRVRQVPAGPDTTPPAVSIISARYVTQGGQTALELSVTATDNIGVVAVNFSEGTVQLGAATAGPAPVWRRIVPLNANDTNPRSFRASAGDAAGNTGLSPLFTYVPGPDAPRFLPITGSGSPSSQGLLGLDQNGNLLPFSYSPGGNGGNSPQSSLQLQFPEGGRVIQVDGRDSIEAGHLTLTFGPESPLQLPDGPLSLDLPPGENVLVPLGELTIAQLLTALGRPANSGLEVLLFGRFRLKLLSGTITETGILSPEWDFSALGLPLPDRVAPWAAGTADLLSGKEAVFPIAGIIPLPGLDGAAGPQLVIGRDRPLLLRLRPDGTISLDGRADLEFPGGARFGVEVSLDDPNYCFTVRAESLTLPLASSLADLLPGNAAGCVPAVAQPAAMDTADQCLRAYLRAYRLFAREADALRPAGPEDGFRRLPANPDGAASAIADALAASLATPVALNLPVQPLRDLAAFFNGTGTNSPDATAPAAVLAAIQRLEEALATIPAGPGEIPADVRAEIQAAASAAARTIIRHAQESVRAGSLPAIQRALEDLSMVDLSAGGFLDEELRGGVATARNNLATQWITGFAVPLGIVSTSSGLTAQLNALDRFAAMQRVTDLVDFSASLQLAGLTAFPGSDLLAPSRRLLLLRAFTALQQQFDEHLLQENVPASLLDLADLTDLVANAALMGASDPAFPDNDDILARLNAISVLIDRELTLPRGERTFFDLTAKTRALLDAARVLPPALPAAQASMQRLHTALAAALLPQLTSEVALANLSPDGLFQLLQAGALYTRLGTRFGLTNSLPWEGQHLVNVTGLLAAAAGSAQAWPLLHDAALFLLDEANAIKNSPVQTPATPAARRLYQVQAALVLEALRVTALDVWELSAAERAKSPPATLADAFLPGDLQIDRVTGGFCFNRFSRAFEGTFGGQLRLPKFNGALTISHGRFTSSGDFEIEAHGHLDFPPPPAGGPALVSADISASQPVRLSYSVARGLRFSGSMRVALSNGVTFTAAAAFLDPVYAFRFEAAGLNFDVLQAISSSLPGFPAPDGATALTYDEEKLGRWAELYTGFGGAAEQIADGGGGGQARDNHNLPGVPSPDATWQSLRGWLAARELSGASPPNAEVRARVTEYFAQQVRELIAQNTLIDQLGGDPFASGGGGGAAVRVRRGGPAPLDALQFDFGPGGQFSGAGPAQSGGSIPADQLTWNFPSADTPGGLLKADGSAMGGVALDFGKFPLLDDRNIDWSGTTVPVSLPAGGSSIYADGTASFSSFHETDNTGVAVRLTGLPAGAWRVFVPYSRMPFRTVGSAVDMTPGQLIRAGRERPSAPAAERLSLQMPVSLEKTVASSTQWNAGDNFATWLVDLSPGDNLVVTSIGNGLRRTGFLQGLQVVRVPVAIEEFGVNPVSPLEGLSKGTPVTLRWRVRNATSLEIQPGIGPLAALEGQMVVNATQSTQYVLTARSASGEITAVASVVIAGQPDTKGFEDALGDIAEKLGDIADVLEDPALAGDAIDSAQLERYFCDPAGVDLGDVVRQRILGNESLKQDFGAVRAAIRMGLDIQAIAALLGVSCLEDLMNEIVAFADDGIEIHERRMGRNADGTINAQKVAEFGAAQSRATISGLLDVYADMQSLGSDRLMNEGLLIAHAGNEREKLLAQIAYQEGPPVTAGVESMEPEEIYSVAAALLRNADRLAALNDPLPDLPQELWGILGLAIERWAHLELTVTPRDQWRSLSQWIERVQAANTLLLFGQEPGTFPSDLGFFGGLALDALQAEGQRLPDPEALRLLTLLLEPATKRALGQPPNTPPDPAMAETWEEVMENFLIHISGLIDEPIDDEAEMIRAGMLAEKLSAVGVLVNDFRRTGVPLGLIALLEPSSQLQRLSDSFDAAARARDQALKQAGDRKGRAALMFLRGSITAKFTAAAARLRTNAGAAVARGGTDSPVRESLRRALASMSADAAEIGAEIAALDAPNGLGDLGVPGGLTIERLGGSLYYNRDTGYLRGGLTGRMAMPGNGFFLDVQEATLDSNGTYSLDLTTGGTVPLGGSSKLLFDVDSLTAAGTAAGRFSFAGAATLQFDGSAQPGDEFSLDVSTGFDSQTGQLAIGTDINTPLKFSSDIMLLDGSVDVEFSTTHPAGALVLDGKLGLLSRGNPLPPGGTPDESDFLLVLDINPTAFRFSDTDFTAEFTGGTLTLAPELFSREVNGQPAPASVALAGTLCVCYDFATRQIEFCAPGGQPFTLALSNLKLALQEIPGFELLINNATLELSGTQFPVLKNLSANFQFPLPGMDATNAQQNRLVSIDVTGRDWRIDGFPREVSFALAQNLRIADLDGLDVDLLGGNALPGCATTFSLTSQNVAGQQQIQLGLNGGMRVAFEQKLVDNANQPGTAVAATACGSFTWDFESLPAFVLSTAQIEGRFLFGGPGGIVISGVQPGTLATLTFTGVENLHRLTGLSPFTVGFSGAMEVANFVKFGLNNARMTWDGTSLIPVVTLGGAQASLGSEAVKLAEGFLPVYPTLIGVEFLNQNPQERPLFPGPGQTGLLDPLNMRLLLSGVVSIPPPVAGAPGGGTPADLPGLGGSVENLGITLMRQGDQIVPNFSLNGLGLKLSGVDVPPLGGLNGTLYVGNLNDPANLYFAGSVGGSVNEVGAKISLGVHRAKGLLGAVFDLDVGPAGIPIDGGALGGILLTGGSGGLSFGNTFAQPDDFLDSIQFATVNGEKQPVNDGAPDAFPPTGAPAPVTYPATPQIPGGTFNSCITGTFPPPTINPLSKLHPTIADRIIFKGTNLHPTIPNNDLGIPLTLNSLGITPATVPAGSVNSAVTFAVQQITQPVRDFANGLVNAVPPVVDAKVKAYYASLLDKQIRQLETSATNVLTQALGQAVGVNPNASFYDAIVTAAARGIPSLDATLRLQGNFSHAAVSTVLKGKGAVTVSTTGTATLDGTIELIGIPVGEGVLALSITDTQGNINPSFGGVLHAGVGPLTLGDMSMAYECNGCFTAVLDSFQVFLATNADTMGAASRQLLVEMMNRTVPVSPPRVLTGDPGAYWMELSDAQRMAFVANLFNIVEVLGEGRPLPPGITAPVVSGFIGSFQQFVSDVLLQVNPRFCFQAKVKPAIFGFPLVPGPTPLDARFAYERVHDQALNQDFQQLSANTVFSPAFIMGALTSGGFAALMPASDQVNAGFSFRVPAFTPANVDLAMRNPAQFALNQFTTMVSDSTLTFGYAFMPLGIPLAEGQARMIMPRLINHPSNPNRPRGAWEAPAPAPYVPPSGGIYATRDEVLTAALARGRLQDPNWRGVRGELDDLFFQPFDPPPPPGTPQHRVTQIAARLNAAQMDLVGFAEDYFPHGGIIGASQLQLPKVLADALPADLIAKVFNPANPTWLADAQNLFTNYLTANTVVGQMGAYIPAPNVPQGFDFATGSPQALIDSLITGNPLAILQKTAPAGVYPFDQVMLSGWMKAQVLGMPLADASVRLDAATGTFKAQAGISQGSWLSSFIGASAELEISKPAILNSPPTGTSIEQIYGAMPQGTVQERFQALQATLGRANINTVITTIQDTLPKTRLEVAANVQIPTALQTVLRSNGAANAQFFAFSPGFDRNFQPTNNAPYAVARRRGGLGFRGAYQLGYFPTTGQPIVIDIPDASFAITPTANIAAFPALTAQLLIGQVNIPGAPALRNGVIQFASSPDNLAPYLAVAGTMDPFKFSLPNPLGGTIDLLSFQPLNPGGTIGGELRISRQDGAPLNTAASLAMDPMSAVFPMLGPGVAVTMHGGVIGGQYQRLNFSTQSNQPWSAQVALSAPGNPNAAPAFSIRDPLNPGNPQGLMSFTPSGPVSGFISGVGLNSFQMQVTVPTGFTVTFFGGTDHQSNVNVPAGDQFTLYADSSGRFYVNLGGLTNLNLPGLMSANATIEFGYNPDDPQPNVTRTPTSRNFGTVNMVDTVSQNVTVSNTGTLLANVSLSINQPGSPDARDFTVSSSGFQLEPGGSRTVPVTFQPKRSGARSASLEVSSDDPDTPLLTVSLSGSGLQEPRYFQSRDTIAFGDTLVGATSSDTITIGNTGSANMTINSVSVTGAGFTVTPAGAATVTPGQQRVYTLTFTPPALGAASGTLTINCAAPVGVRTIPLSGTGSESRWLTLLDSGTAGSTAQLNALRMLDPNRGLVVGSQGTFLETRNGGRSWVPRRLTNQSLNAVVLDRSTINNSALALYHFEEPPGSTTYLDSSGNGLHGVSVPSPGTAVLSFAHGRFGSGLNFDGTDDYAELGNLTLPSSFSIALWAMFRENTNGQAIISKTTSAGGNQLIFGKYNNGLQINFGSQVWTVPHNPPLNIWTQFVVTGSYDSVANQTTVFMHRRQIGGSSQTLGSNVFTGAVSTGAGKPWSLGQEWDSSTLTTDHFNGMIDEVVFYDGVISSTVRAALFSKNGARLVVAGAGGRVYQTFTDGDTWAQLPDLNAFGWRNQTRTFERYNWNAAAFVGNTLFLGGSMVTTGDFGIQLHSRHVMEENLDAGLDNIAGNEDDEFAAVPFAHANISVNPQVTGLATTGFSALAVTNEGVLHLKDTVEPVFFSRSPNTAPNALNAVGAFGTTNQYLAVGDNGVIIRADGGAHAVVASGTPADLEGMTFDPNVSPSWHVVGEGGAYLTSSNNGANWQLVADGLTGNMRTVDVEAVPGGTSTQYHTWAAGANHTINYRPPAAVTGPFFTFFPGKLDFGFVTTNQSRTLTVTLANKGKQPLQISSLVFVGPGAPRFSLGSTTVDRLEPGDSTQLNVRYRPTVASEFDAAELVLTTNDPTPAFRLTLEGRSAANEWQPVTLLNAGLPFEGEVMKVVFTSSSRGYALVNPPAGASVLYRTNDGGLTWTRSTFPTSGGVVKLTGFEFVRHTTDAGSTTDIGLACGHVEDASGVFIRGLLLRCSTSIISFNTPSWFDRTPLASGQTTQPLRVFDVSAISLGGFLIASASTTGNTSTANVWSGLDDLTSWTEKGSRPSGYPGGLVGVERYGAEPDFTFLFSTGGGDVFVNSWTGNWFSGAKRLSSSSVVKDMDFVLTPSLNGNLNRGWLVGNDGFFMLWEQQASTQAQQFFPAKDAEVFGTVDLTGVKFSDADNGWVVGDSRAFDSHDKGLTWSLAFDAGGLASFRTVATTSVSQAWIGGSLDGKATVWRYTPPPATGRGLLSSADRVDWGTVTPETTSTRNIRLNNTSSTALPLHDFSIDSDEPAPRFRILSDLPDSIAANSFVDLIVAFSALAEAPLAEELQPEFLHRFEQAYDDAVMRDDSINARHGNGAVPAAQRPKIVRSFFRDRCVMFDGVDDRVELSTAAPIVSFDTLPANYTVALWTAPDTLSGTRTLVSKDLNAGSDGLKITQTSTGYQVRIRSLTATFASVPVTDWTHLAFVFVQSGSNTLVTLYRDGAAVSTQSIAAVAGSLAGRPWTFGAEWTSNTATTAFFSGCLDDVAVFARALTEGEVGRLMGKSPLFGEHRAQLLVNSGSEHGTRTIDLRALVAPAPKMIVFNTEPQGRQVTIDGVNFTTPVAFAVTAVASGAAGSREWVEGSQHRITTAEETFNLTAADGTVTTYGFSEWQGGGARAFELTASRTGSAAITAIFQPRSVTPPAPPGPPPPRAGGPNPLLAGLANSPKGPFFRLSNGSLKLPGLGATGFAISGEVLFSLQLIKGHIETTALNLPETGDKQLEIGASRWRFLATAGGDIELFAAPPSVRILGHDVLPSGTVRLRHTSAAGLWAVEMTLQRDFKPYPDLLEIKKGFTRISWAPAVLPPVFALEFQSGLRLLKQPNGVFAFDQNMNVRIDTANFNISLDSLLTAAGLSPPPRLIQAGPFEVGWGDVRIRRTGGGPVFIEVNNVPFRVNGTQVVNVSGSVNTDGALALTGAILQNGRIHLDTNGQTFLEKTTSGSANFNFLIQPLPSPRLRLQTPALRLKTTATGATGNVFPSSGISIPAITVDTNGDFDTGRLPLPAFDFDGIDVAGDPNGTRRRNHIRLRRENGKVTFKVKSQQSFVGCRQKLSLTVESRTSATPKVKGSISGNFCVLPEDLSLNYSSSSSCQFSGSAFGFTVRFGGSCAGVEENNTGACVVGDCN